MRTLYVSDLDGTLLRPDGRVSAYSLGVLNRLIEAGVLFTYATARSLSSGQFKSSVSPGTRMDAASMGSIAFFAPWTRRLPSRGMPPWTRQIVIIFSLHRQFCSILCAGGGI